VVQILCLVLWSIQYPPPVSNLKSSETLKVAKGGQLMILSYFTFSNTPKPLGRSIKAHARLPARLQANGHGPQGGARFRPRRASRARGCVARRSVGESRAVRTGKLVQPMAARSGQIRNFAVFFKDEDDDEEDGGQAAEPPALRRAGAPFIHSAGPGRNMSRRRSEYMKMTPPCFNHRSKRQMAPPEVSIKTSETRAVRLGTKTWCSSSLAA
jgi:hypothetical protein